MDIFFTRFTLKWLFRLALTILFGFAFTLIFPHRENPWLIMGMLSAIALADGIKLVPRISKLLLLGIITSLSVLAAGFAQYYMAVNIAFIFFIPLLFIWFGYRHHHWLKPILWITLLSIIAALQIMTPVQSLYRSGLLAGGFVVVCVGMFNIPRWFVKQEVQVAIDIALRSLKQLTTEVFDCFTVEYADNIYFFERRLHEQKYKVMESLLRLKRLPLGSNFIEECNNIYLALLDCAQLRWRVSDAATFELCREEMVNLKKALLQAFDSLIKTHATQRVSPLTSLNQPIERLEENYQTILQIAAREPLVFLLFLASIKRLQLAIHSLYEQERVHG